MTCLSSAANLRCVSSLARRRWRGPGSRSRRPNLRQRSTRRLPCPRPSRYRPRRHHRRRRRQHRALRSRNLRRRLPPPPHQIRPRRSSTTLDESPKRAETDTSLGSRDSDVPQPPPSDSGTRGPRRPRSRADSAAASTGADPQRGSRIRSSRRPDVAPTSLRYRDGGGCPQQSRSRSPRPDTGPHPCVSAQGRDPRRSGHPPRASAPRLRPGRSRLAVSLAGRAGRGSDRLTEQRLLHGRGLPGDDDGARRRAPRLAGSGQGGDRASHGDRPGKALCQPSRIHRHHGLRVRRPAARRQRCEAVPSGYAEWRACAHRCIVAAGQGAARAHPRGVRVRRHPTAAVSRSQRVPARPG
jgi:hypothetical protein